MAGRFDRAIGRRASSQSGVSILIALAFVLVCTAVAVIVISSASVNVERLRGYKTEQQSYLAKVSALNLVESVIVGDPKRDDDGVRVKKTTSGNKVLFSPQGTDDLGITAWMVAYGNGANTGKLTLEVDASALNSKSSTDVGKVTVEVSFNGIDVRLRAYDDLDGSASSDGAVSNLTRNLATHEDAGVLTWGTQGASS